MADLAGTTVDFGSSAPAGMFVSLFQRHGGPFTEADLDRLYADFIPLQMEVLPDFGDLVPGTAESAAALRALGVKVAVTTGYDTAMMKIVLDAAARQGFVPDAAICAGDVAAGRPPG